MLDHPVRGVIPFRLSRCGDPGGRGAAGESGDPGRIKAAASWSSCATGFITARRWRSLVKPGVEWGFGVMVFGLCFAWPQDRKARRILEDGRRVRGAELVTRDEFNRKTEIPPRDRIQDAGDARACASGC